MGCQGMAAYFFLWVTYLDEYQIGTPKNKA